MTTKKESPSADKIDELCKSYHDLKDASDKAAKVLSKAKGELLPVIDGFGFTAPHAEKTIRLEGFKWVADATRSSTVDINEASIATLQSELSRMGKPKTFGKLFQRSVKHGLKKDAADQLKSDIHGMKEEDRIYLLSLFAGCFSVGQKAPSVTVELISTLKAKEDAAAEKAKAKEAAAAEKAAKKAAKEAERETRNSAKQAKKGTAK